MSSPRGIIGDDPVSDLRIMAGAVAVLIVAIHLFHPRYGALRLMEFLRIGILLNPLPVLFTLASLLMVFGIVLASQQTLLREVYLLGIVLMVSFILGYAAWHTVLDHGAFWPYIEGHAHHEKGPIRLLIAHALDDTLGMISKILETVLAIVLAVLYKIDPHIRE